MPNASPYILVAFAAYMVGVFLLGALSHALLKRGSFLKEYFLGDRQLNAWVLGLTYVATSVSAGSFVGFPSFIYSYGWVMAFWIGGYMVGGLVSKGVLAKRLNQVSRLSGAITVPDVLRDRFQSPALGSLAGLFLLFFLLINLVAQFKAGGLILRQASRGVRDTVVYQTARQGTADALTATGVWTPDAGKSDPDYGEEYPEYIIGVLVFALTVVAYTTYGGFWAVTWTDVLQGLVILAGAFLLMILALIKVGGMEAATDKLRVIDPHLLTGPGPEAHVPLTLAVSYFCLWTLGAMGQPVGMVRLMACRDTPTLRRSLFLIGVYYALIYLPLVVTFICARAIFPTDYVEDSDNIMPVMALAVTEGFPVVGGLLLAAPYAAAMSAVAGFLLLMSSSLVRDLYQRNFNPDVSPRAVRWISYGTTAVVGTVITAVAFHPPHLLQYVIILSGAGMACTFLAPTVMALYWKRATRAGALAALCSGVLTVLLLYVLGWEGVGKGGSDAIVPAQTAVEGSVPTEPAPIEIKKAAENRIAPFYLFHLDPLIYGLVVSFTVGVVVSLLTKPLPADQVHRYFIEQDASVPPADGASRPPEI
jgi:SSS family solute:Na+ symporter/sodium/pantothenate symporter